MRKIYKYSLEITDVQTLQIPLLEVRYVGIDPNRDPCLWAEIDTDLPHREVKVYVIGTGNPFPQGATKYVGSFVHHGTFVWHVYI